MVGYDPGRVYLCKACTGELVATADLASVPPPEVVRPSTRAENEFGRYFSPVEIGRGGMGVVYKAWDESHQRWVALKVIKDTGHLEELTRFRREVEFARALHHPNIVALYEVTHAGDNHQIAMEYIDGQTLAGLRLPPKWAAELIGQVAHALQYAHSRGIVHRDIKPQNIMIDRTGKPYLMDFGLAKSTGHSSSITSVGTAMGTPSYMAPEQAIGRTSRVDRRTDVYSLGAVLYDLVTGCPPFRGANPLDTIKKVVYEEVTPPSRVAADVPAPLETIVLRCLEKDKNRRYQTAKHLAEDLERFARDVTP
jgi:serine/threonine protein kinase